MVQTIFSALWGQNQNRIKTNKNPPNSQKAAGRDARSLKEQTDPDGGDKGGTLVFNAHLTVLATVVFSVIFIYRPGGGYKKWPCHFSCLYTTFLSLYFLLQDSSLYLSRRKCS